MKEFFKSQFLKKYDQICVVESLSCNFDLNFANFNEKKVAKYISETLFKTGCTFLS